VVGDEMREDDEREVEDAGMAKGVYRLGV